jgi:hypothetical protein
MHFLRSTRIMRIRNFLRQPSPWLRTGRPDRPDHAAKSVGAKIGHALVQRHAVAPIVSGVADLPDSFTYGYALHTHIHVRCRRLVVSQRTPIGGLIVEDNVPIALWRRSCTSSPTWPERDDTIPQSICA